MLLSAVSVLVVAQSSSEVPEGLMNNPVFLTDQTLPVMAQRIFSSCREHHEKSRHNTAEVQTVWDYSKL